MQDDQEIQWFAIRYRQSTNRSRATAFLGGEFEQYVDKKGRKRKRRIKGTGQREFVIETILRKRDFQVFLPTKKVWRRKSRYTKEKQLVAYPLLVGWVFVGWPKGENRWADLFRVRLVYEVAGIDGRPYPIPQSIMDDMLKRWGGPKTQAPEREQFMRTHFEFKIGDQVKIVEGPFDGAVVRVVDLRGQNAQVVLELLGGERAIDIKTWSLVAA